MNMSRANKSREERLNLSELQDSIKECVRFILCREGSKITIKRAEIMKHLNTVCQTTSNELGLVLVEADKVLKRVYGYKLVQIKPKEPKQYILVLNEACESTTMPTLTDEHHKKILAAALTHIFMNGAPVKEDDMWKFLTDAGLMEENDIASRKLLTTTFKRQMYLQYDKVQVGDGQLTKGEFKWGERAIEEVPKMFILNKVAKALDKTPDYWCEQHKEALEESAAEA